MSTVALLGFGRFGRALASLLLEAGHAVRAYDPHASVPDELRAASAADLVSGADFVVIAVPVAHVPGALRELRPHLRPVHVVFDVASVKSRPVEAMRASLGAAIIPTKICGPFRAVL